MYDPGDQPVKFIHDKRAQKPRTHRILAFVRFAFWLVVVVVVLVVSVRVYQTYEANRLFANADRHYEAGRYEEAIAVWNQSLKNPQFDKGIVYRNIADAYHAQRKHRLAEEFYRKSLAIKEDAVTYHHLSEALRSLGDTAGATIAAQRARGLISTDGASGD